MDFYWRQAQLLCDVRVLDQQRLVDRAPLDHLGNERAGGNGRPTAECLELCVDDAVVLINFNLQLHHIAARRSAHEARADVGLELVERPDIAGSLVVVDHLHTRHHIDRLLVSYAENISVTQHVTQQSVTNAYQRIQK